MPTVSHDPGVVDREAVIHGVRWAAVEYGPRSHRIDWCSTPHSGYVVSGSLLYEFEDERSSLRLRAGDAFILPKQPRHRGRNEEASTARIFLIDTVPFEGG